MVLLCVSGDVDLIFLCSIRDGRRSARPMPGDGRKRGGMWSFGVKLSRAPKCSCSCGRLAAPSVRNFAGAGDALICQHRIVVCLQEHHQHIIMQITTHLYNLQMLICPSYNSSDSYADGCVKKIGQTSLDFIRVNDFHFALYSTTSSPAILLLHLTKTSNLQKERTSMPCTFCFSHPAFLSRGERER